MIVKPQLIYPTYEGQIEDFDLSENMMVFRTSNNEVYYSGLWKYFVPFKCQLPESVQVKSIGAAEDGFGVVDRSQYRLRREWKSLWLE